MGGPRSSCALRASLTTPCAGPPGLNVGLPTSGRGRTDVRRPRLQKVLRNTRDRARNARTTEDDGRAPKRHSPPFPLGDAVERCVVTPTEAKEVRTATCVPHRVASRPRKGRRGHAREVRRIGDGDGRPGSRGTPAGGAGIGSPGLGDPFFKLAGNGGYDVGHYGLALDYEPRPASSTGRRSSRRAPRSRSRASTWTCAASTSACCWSTAARPRYRRAGQELIVTPRQALRAGRDFTVSCATPACRRSSPTPTTRSRAGCRPPTAPSSSASRRARRAGSRPTTTRRTRRPSTWPSRCPTASPRWATACSPGASPTAGARPGCGTRATRWPRTWRRRPTGAST